MDVVGEEGSAGRVDEEILHRASGAPCGSAGSDAMTSRELEGLLGRIGARGGPARYSVRGRLTGRGGGDWFRVWDDDLRREVAMHVAAEAGGVGSAALESQRLLAQARVVGRLDHPAIAPIHDVAVDGSGRPYYTTKLLEGRTLAVALAQGGWSLPQTLTAIVRVCEALGHAHERGIAHGEVSEEHVELGGHGEVYLVGWSATAGGEPAGDVRAMEALVGRIARASGRPGSAARRIEHPELAAIAEARYPSIDALADDLRAFLDGRPVAAYRTGALVELRKWIARNRALALAIGVFVATATGIGAGGAYFASTEAAAEELRLERDLERAEEHIQRGYVLLDLEPDEARAEFERALTIDAGSDLASWGLALERIEAGDPGAALAILDAYERADAARPRLTMGRVAALSALGRDDEAIELRASVGGELGHLGHFIVGSGRRIESEAERSIRPLPGTGSPLVASNVEYARTAVRHLERAVSQAPTKRASYDMELLRACANATEWGTAIRYAGAALERWPTSAPVHLSAGIALLTNDDPRAALAALERAEDLDPELPDVRVQRGIALHVLGRDEEALAAVEAEIESFPDRPRAHLDRARIQQRLGELDIALGELERALALVPDASVLRVGMVSMLLGAGRVDEAMEVCTTALEADPDSAGLREISGLTHIEAEDYEGARSEYQRATELEPGRDAAYFGWVRATRLLGLEDELAGIHEAWSADCPRALVAHLAVADDRIVRGDIAGAMLAAERAIEADPEDPDARWRRARYLSSDGRLEAALSEYDLVLRLRPATWEAHSDRVHVLLRLGRVDRAHARSLQFLQLRPDEPSAHYLVGLCLLERGDDAGGIEAIKNAVSLGPELTDFRWNLAATLMNVGRYREALQEVRILEERGPARQDWSEVQAWLASTLEGHVRALDLLEEIESGVAEAPEDIERGRPLVVVAVGTERHELGLELASRYTDTAGTDRRVDLTIGVCSIRCAAALIRSSEDPGPWVERFVRESSQILDLGRFISGQGTPLGPLWRTRFEELVSSTEFDSLRGTGALDGLTPSDRADCEETLRELVEFLEQLP